MGPLKINGFGFGSDWTLPMTISVLLLLVILFYLCLSFFMVNTIYTLFYLLHTFSPFVAVNIS